MICSGKLPIIQDRLRGFETEFRPIRKSQNAVKRAEAVRRRDATD